MWLIREKLFWLATGLGLTVATLAGLPLGTFLASALGLSDDASMYVIMGSVFVMLIVVGWAGDRIYLWWSLRKDWL